jgi:Fe-S cluster biogenesis protein NfuA
VEEVDCPNVKSMLQGACASCVFWLLSVERLDRMLKMAWDSHSTPVLKSIEKSVESDMS